MAARRQLARVARELWGLGGEVWEEGSPVRRMAGKPPRFPAALCAGRRREPARPAGASRDFRAAAAAPANSQIFHSRDMLHFLI